MVIGIDASRANAVKKTGTEWYAYAVIQELKKIIPPEHQVVLYSKEPLFDELAQLPASWTSRVLRWPPLFLWTQLRLSCEMLFHRPDMLYIPTHTIPFIHPKRIALVIHDVGFARTAELYDHASIGYQGTLAKRSINLLVRVFTRGRYGATEHDYHRFSVAHAIRTKTQLITISAFSQQEIHAVYGVPTQEIAVIPNGLNRRTPVSEADAHVTLKKYGIRKPYLLFVGRVEEKKNIPRLIDAFAILRSKYGFSGQLVLAGSPGYGHNRVQRKIKEQGLREMVIETGWVPEEEISALLSSATLFVFPSLYEGFGIPILEAMASSVPVVCSSIPPLLEVAQDASLTADPQSTENIAQALYTVLSQPEVRDALIAKGRERAAEFSWEKTARATWDILKNS